MAVRQPDKRKGNFVAVYCLQKTFVLPEFLKVPVGQTV